jgi:DNA-binding MarR family transcriptional regulator
MNPANRASGRPQPPLAAPEERAVPMTLQVLLQGVRKSIAATAALALAPLGLTHAQFRILIRIKNSKDATAAQVARAEGYDGGAASRLIKGFLQTGLMARNCNCRDGRTHRLTLTSLGHDVVSASHAALNDHWEEVLADWDDDDRVRLAELVDKLGKKTEVVPAI